MSSKGIDIKINSAFNADGVLQANRGLAKLAQDVKGANDEMRRATMRAEMSVNSYAEHADKAVRAMGGGYKTLGEQLAELGKANAAVGTSAKAAGEVATKSAVGLEMAMGLARGSTEQTAKAFAMLSQRIPILGRIGVTACGAWAAAIGGVYSLATSLYELVETAFNLNAVSKDISEASAAMLDLNNAAETYNAAMDDARKSAKERTKSIEDEANAIAKAEKAQIELNRQKALGKAATENEKAAINLKAESESASVDDLNAQVMREAKRNELLDERKRLIGDIANAEKTLTDSRKYFGKGVGAEDAALDARDAAENAKKGVKRTDAELKAIDEEEAAANIIIAARKEREKNAAAEIEEANIQAAKKAETERLKAVEAEKKAREKMEDDLHRQRVENIRAEVEVSQAAANGKQNVANAAQSEFDRAFGWWRSEDKGASAIAEERAYAADYKRLGKEANRYGGKWRIDELASLMAAGDTKGQAAKLEEWRKSRSFTPEVESMVRASAADQTRTTAEDELRKIEANTAGLKEKMDELLAMK